MRRLERVSRSRRDVGARRTCRDFVIDLCQFGDRGLDEQPVAFVFLTPSN